MAVDPRERQLAKIATAAGRRHAIEGDLVHFVIDARKMGIRWADIADAHGLTRQGVTSRYARYLEGVR